MENTTSQTLFDFNDDEIKELQEIANPVKMLSQPTLQQPIQQPQSLKPLNSILKSNNDEDDDVSDITNDNDDEEDEDDEEEEESSRAVASIISNENDKLDMLMKLNMLRENGHIVKNYSLDTKTSDIKMELYRVKRGIELNASIKFQQKMLMASITAIEFLNKRYDPFDVKLEGWSENVLENIDDFSGIFEKLYDKYKKKKEMAPELELLLAVAGSAFMFNLTNSMFKNLHIENKTIRNLKQTVKNAFNAAGGMMPQEPVQPVMHNTATPSLSELTNAALSATASAFGNRNMPVFSTQPPPTQQQPLPQQQYTAPPQPNQQKFADLQQQMINEHMKNDMDDDNDRFSIASSSGSSSSIRNPERKNVSRGGKVVRGGGRGNGGGRGSGGRKKEFVL